MADEPGADPSTTPEATSLQTETNPGERIGSGLIVRLIVKVCPWQPDELMPAMP